MQEALKTITQFDRVEQHINQLKKIQFRHEPLCAYIYDLDALDDHLRQVMRFLPKQCQMFYAAKANAEVPILKTMAQHCYGFEVASMGELSKIRQQYPNIPIAFGGPGKTDDELSACLQQDVQFIQVESLYELQRLSHICHKNNQTVQILLRLNLKFDEFNQTRLTMGSKPSPFGMDETMLQSCLAYLVGHQLIQLKGLHFHLASFQVDEYKHAKLIAQYIDYLHHINRTHRLNLTHLNVGGGVGVDYADKSHRFNWQLFFNLLNQTLSHDDNKELSIYFECGRSLSVYCGYYAVEVIDIKQSHGEYFVITRGGTHHFRTPYAQSHSHPFTTTPVKHWDKAYQRITIADKEVTIVGQLCTPKDVLAYKQMIKHLSIGDIIVFSHAGAYAWNISHHDFLCHPHPEHYFLGETNE